MHQRQLRATSAPCAARHSRSCRESQHSSSCRRWLGAQGQPRPSCACCVRLGHHPAGRGLTRPLAVAGHHTQGPEAGEHSADKAQTDQAGRLWPVHRCHAGASCHTGWHAGLHGPRGRATGAPAPQHKLLSMSAHLPEAGAAGHLLGRRRAQQTYCSAVCLLSEPGCWWPCDPLHTARAQRLPWAPSLG